MRKMVIVERCKFAQLLRSYKKSLYLNRVLEHICRQYRSYVTLTADEVCELIELDRDTVIRKTLHGRLLCRYGKRRQILRYYGFD